MICKKITKCRVCGNTDLISVLNLGDQYLTGVFPKPGEKVESGPLELVKCNEENSDDCCGLLQLAHNFDLEALYGDNYGYRSGLNKSMVNHLEEIVRKVEEIVTFEKDDLVIDIGSNDCTLLKQYKNDELRMVGIDPTAEKFKTHYPKRISYVPDFFSSDLIESNFDGKAKVITSIAMFYDLVDPIDFARQVESILDDSGIWVLEQSYMPMMIKNNSYDTVCHEHLEYYGLKQLIWIMDAVGLRVIDVSLNSTNGASFQVVVAKVDSDHVADQKAIERLLETEENDGFRELNVYEDFRVQTEKHRDDLVMFVRKIIARGQTIVGYGASTKGNVILQYCGFTSKEFSCIAEVNEYKFGRVTPGSDIPIVSEEKAKALNPDYLFVLPWHFKNNITEREKDFIDSGGRLLFPLPSIEEAGK